MASPIPTRPSLPVIRDVSGSYTAYSFESIEPDIYFDPEFNAQISRQGTSVNIGAGLNRPLDRALTVITKDDLVRLTR
jgi:hypothetical protein